MISLLFASLLVAQAAQPAPIEEDRLRVCLEQARSDPATAIAMASDWLEHAREVERSYPRQCLGFAFTSLLRWDAARDAFIAARDARAAVDFTGRARLGAMAGNAALAAQDLDGALALLTTAQADAVAAGEGEVAGTVSADRARVLVALDRPGEAEDALERARELAPQVADVWLLSAALARRQGDLVTAQGHIATANRLDPLSGAVGVEAGLIAALGGADEAARTAWQSVIDTNRESPEADMARAYLTQLETEAPQP